METSKTSTGQPLSDLTLFAVDTLASHLASQDDDKEQTTHDTFGLGCEPPLANYDPTMRCWKTSEDTSLWGELRLLVNLPKSGMTQNGALFQQLDWVRPIDETDLLLWPTPTTQEVEHPNAELTPSGRRKSKNGKTSHSLGLADAVQMWPTPRASKAMADSPEAIIRNLKKKGYKSKLEQAVQMWPTPTASSWGNEGSRNMLDKHVQSGNITEQDKRAMTAGNGGKLNPTWVEWLMGFPTGWTDLED
jgi:DNA (cytosine-5)-methyltransferase 1